MRKQVYPATLYAPKRAHSSINDRNLQIDVDVQSAHPRKSASDQMSVLRKLQRNSTIQ